jgi:hypothetical protein
MADDDRPTSSSDDGEDYEILPEKEIQGLKDELRKLKDFEITPTKKLGVQLIELNTKLDKMLSIFEEATTALQLEEGGLSFKDKMRPVVEKMNKILEQNSEIAQGIVAVADLVKDLRNDMDKGVTVKESAIEGPQPMPLPPGNFGQQPPAPQGMPPMMPPPGMPRMMMPGIPPPPRRRRFGL